MRITLLLLPLMEMCFDYMEFFLTSSVHLTLT